MQINIFFVKNSKNYYSFPPLLAALEGLPYVRTQLVNSSFLNSFKDETADNLNVFGFSFNTIAFLKEQKILKHTISKLKGRSVFFIAGGAHPTACPEELLSFGFDAVVKGDGELAIVDIVKKLHEGQKITGVFEHKITNLDEHPPFPNCKSYYKPIEITRGCYYACNYCQTSFLFNKKPVHRSIDNIIFFLKRAFEWGYRDFRFISPNALGYGTYAKTPDLAILSQLLSKIKTVIGNKGRLFFGSFPSEIRPEFATLDAMLLLKEYVDNKRVIIGAQTASDRMLKLSHRGHSVYDIEQAIENTLTAGFQADIDIIFGMPEETEEDVQETINFIEKHASKNVKFHLHYFIPLPGTPWSNKKPAFLSKNVIKLLQRLTGAGKVWGTWLAQKTYTKF